MQQSAFDYPLQTECEEWILVSKLMIEELTGEIGSPKVSAAPVAAEEPPSDDNDEKVGRLRIIAIL